MWKDLTNLFFCKTQRGFSNIISNPNLIGLNQSIQFSIFFSHFFFAHLMKFFVKDCVGIVPRSHVTLQALQELISVNKKNPFHHTKTILLTA